MCSRTPRATLELPLGASSPARAREFLRRTSCPHHAQQMVEPAVLLVSELVTNSVRYGGPPIVVAVECGEHSIEVRVRDGNPELPRPRPVEALAEGGRGLTLLDLVSDRWGVDLDPDGKSVWFLLRAAD